MIFRNLRLVLSATVSSSAFRIGTTAANGFPRLITMIGSFLALSAYSDSGLEAFLNRTFVIARDSLRLDNEADTILQRPCVRKIEQVELRMKLWRYFRITLTPTAALDF